MTDVNVVDKSITDKSIIDKSISEVIKSKQKEKEQIKNKKLEKSKNKYNNIDTLNFNGLDVLQQGDYLWDIFKKMRSEKLKTQTHLLQADCDAILKEYHMEYKKFCEMFPIVVRYMCQFQSYNSKAFERYLVKMQHNPPTNKKEHVVDRNADYIKYLWLEMNKKHPNRINESNKVWGEAYKLLNDEFENYLAVEEKARETIKERELEALAQKRKELLAFIEKCKTTTS
jgi:hypothetical protein